MKKAKIMSLFALINFKYLIISKNENKTYDLLSDQNLIVKEIFQTKQNVYTSENNFKFSRGVTVYYNYILFTKRRDWVYVASLLIQGSSCTVLQGFISVYTFFSDIWVHWGTMMASSSGVNVKCYLFP